MRILIALLSLISISASAEPQPSYPLKCRGGKIENLTIEFSPTTASLGFKKAAVAAPAGLKAGECSWMDRAIAPSEPSVLEQHPVSPKVIFGTTTIRFGYAPGPTGPVTIVAPLIGGRDPELGWMKELMKPDTYWLFKVYNDRIGHFIVTDAQPTVP